MEIKHFSACNTAPASGAGTAIVQAKGRERPGVCVTPTGRHIAPTSGTGMAILRAWATVNGVTLSYTVTATVF